MRRPRRLPADSLEQTIGMIQHRLNDLPTRRDIHMLTKEVQDLMAQAQRNNSLTASLDKGFRALTLQVSTLQQQIAALQGDGVITEAEKAQLVQTTNDLAASFSTLSADIPANTEAAPPPTDTPPATDQSGGGGSTNQSAPPSTNQPAS